MRFCGRGCQSHPCWFRVASSSSYGVTIPVHVIMASRETILRGSSSGSGKVGFGPASNEGSGSAHLLSHFWGAGLPAPRLSPTQLAQLVGLCQLPARALLQGPSKSRNRSSLGSVQLPSPGGPRLPPSLQTFVNRSNTNAHSSSQELGKTGGGGLRGTGEECSGLRPEMGTAP